MKVKEIQKNLGRAVKLSDTYQSLDALFTEKESQYQLFGIWKEKMDAIAKKPNQAIRIKQIALEGKMNEETLSFLPGSVLKRQILSGNYSIESLEDSAHTYFEDIYRELKLSYDAVTKKDYKKLINLFVETLPNDLRQLIETNAIGCKNIDDVAYAIYIIQVEVKKKHYLDSVWEAEKNNTEFEDLYKIDDIRYALGLNKKITPMMFILIDHLLKRIPNNTDDLNAYKILLANTFDVDPKTITRYLDARMTGDRKNDPLRSRKSLEYALDFFDKLKNKELSKKIEHLLDNL